MHKCDHITPTLKSVHWLPLQTRIEFKISLLTHQALKELLTPHSTPHTHQPPQAP